MLRLLFYFCVILLSLGQFSAVYKSGESNFYLFDIGIGIFAIFGLLYYLSRKNLFIPKPFLFFLAFTALAVVSLLVKFPVLAPFELLVSGFYLMRWVMYLISAVIIFNMLKEDMINIDRIFFIFIYSGIFISIAGLFQLLLLPDFETLDPSLGWDPHKNRLASTFFDPNFTGGYLVLCLILLFSYLAKKFNKIYFIYSVILTVAVFLTFSRSSWVMLAIVVFVYGVLKYRWLLLLSIIVAFSAYYFVPRVQTRLSGTTDPSDSAHFRLISWSNTFDIARDNLLTGVGFNAFRYAQRDYGFLSIDNFEKHSGAGSDSSLLFVLATTGIFGLVVYVLGYLMLVFLPLRDKVSSIAIAGSLLIHSQFVNSLFFPQIMFLLLVYMSVGALRNSDRIPR